MSFSYELVGAHDGLKGIYRLSRDAKNIMEDMSMAGVNKMRDLLIADMRRGKSGVLYRHLNMSRRSSSASGDETPAVQSGKLVKSITTYRVSSQGDRYAGRAAIGAGRGLPRSYAFYLEYGTSKMAPRRLLGRSLVAWQDQIEGAMWDEWNKRKGSYNVK